MTQIFTAVMQKGEPMSDERKTLKTMMMVAMMAAIDGEFSKTPVDFDFESPQDEPEESEDADEEDVG